MIISPFMELDDERRKRDQAMMQSLGNFGSSLANVPLTYQNLLNEQQDRARKIDKDKQELLSKKEKERQETESHNQNMEQGAFNLEKGKTDEANSEKKLKDAEATKSISDMVAGKLAENPDMESKQLIDSVLADPSWKDLPDPNALEAEVNSQLESKGKEKFNEGIKTKGLDVKQQNADTLRLKEQNRMARAAAAKDKLPKPPPNLGNKSLTDLGDLETKYETLGSIERYKDQENIDTGPISGVIQKFRQLSHTQNPKEAALNTELKTVLSDTLHTISGAQVTPQEYARLTQLLPSQYDDEDVYNAITEVAKEMTEREYNNRLKKYTQGGYNTKNIPSLGAPTPNTAPTGQSNGKSVQQGESPMQFKKRMEAMGVSDKEARQLWLSRTQ